MPELMYAASMAFIQKNDRVLIAKRHPNHSNGDGGLWEMPSGRLEKSESFEMALKREVKEETDLEVKIILPIATWFMPEFPLVGVTFVCKYVSGKVRLTLEHTEYKWVKFDRILDYIHKPSMVNHINTYLEWRKRNQKYL